MHRLHSDFDGYTVHHDVEEIRRYSFTMVAKSIYNVFTIGYTISNNTSLILKNHIVLIL